MFLRSMLHVLAVAALASSASSQSIVLESQEILAGQAAIGYFELDAHGHALTDRDVDFFNDSLSFQVVRPDGNRIDVSCGGMGCCQGVVSVKPPTVLTDRIFRVPLFLWFIAGKALFDEHGRYGIEVHIVSREGEHISASAEVDVLEHPDQQLVFDIIAAINFPRNFFVLPFYGIPPLKKERFDPIPAESAYREFIDEKVMFYSMTCSVLRYALADAEMIEQASEAVLGFFDTDDVDLAEAIDGDIYRDCAAGLRRLLGEGEIEERDYMYILPGRY